MIFFIVSLFIYNAEIEAFTRDSLHESNLSLSIGNRGKWLFSEIEGGFALDYADSDIDFGLSDVFLRAGANRYVRIFDVSIFGICHRPGRVREGIIRNFSIRQPGFGFGIGLGAKVSLFAIDADLDFISHSTNPVTKHFLFDSEIKFNPDTLTFGMDFIIERFTMLGQDPFNSIYLKPKVIFAGWENFALSFGLSFLISNRIDETSDNQSLKEIGVNMGDYGLPGWKICCGITSTHFRRKSRRLFPLRIFLVDEEGNPASGLLSLADSGSFRISEGEIEFNLSEGIYPLSVYAENFLPTDTVIVLKQATDIMLSLHEKKEFYIVEGIVKDAETGEPIDADILFENEGTTVVQSDPETGHYRIYVIPGDYVTKVTSKGYYPYTSLIEVETERTIKTDFELLPIKGRSK
jgi:hypothetical protein